MTIGKRQDRKAAGANGPSNTGEMIYLTWPAAVRHAPLRFRETVFVACALVALVAVQLWATGSFYLLRKNFWTDEFCTFTVLSGGGFFHALGALRGAVEINPPGLHLLLFAFTKLAGTSEIALRSFAILSMLTALVGIYAVLRETAAFGVSIAATLAIWAHPLILDHAFEVRYYGPWLAAAAWCCFLIGRAGRRELGPAGSAGLAVAAFLICSIHYFGVVTLALIVAADYLWRRPQWGFSRGTLAALAVGPLTTATAAILLLPGQRSVTTVTTWVPAPTAAQAADFTTTLLMPLHLGAVLIVLWMSRLTARRSETDPSEAAGMSVTSGHAGLTSLGLLVPILIAFSVLIQPALISRYGLPAIAALAPAVAYALARTSKPWVMLLIAFLLASSAFQIRQRVDRAQRFDRATAELIADIRDRSAGERVAFEVPHHLNVVWHYAPDLRDRIFLLDFERGELGDNVSAFRIWSRDLAKQLPKFYAGPALTPWAEVRDTASLFIVPHAESYTSQVPPDRRYAGFVMQPVTRQLHRLVRKDRP
jgi:hypothetical protein